MKIKRYIEARNTLELLIVESELEDLYIKKITTSLEDMMFNVWCNELNLPPMPANFIAEFILKSIRLELKNRWTKIQGSNFSVFSDGVLHDFLKKKETNTLLMILFEYYNWIRHDELPYDSYIYKWFHQLGISVAFKLEYVLPPIMDAVRKEIVSRWFSNSKTPLVL